MATANGTSWSLSTKSNREGGITKSPKFYLRYDLKTNTHRGPEHYIGTIRQSSRMTKWSKLYERFWGFSGRWISSQWTFLRFQSTCVFPTSFDTGRDVEGLFRIASRREGQPNIWETHGLCGNVFANPHASSSVLYPQELKTWGTTIEKPLHMPTAEKSEDQNKIEIWDASLWKWSGPACTSTVLENLESLTACSSQEGCRTWPPSVAQESGSQRAKQELDCAIKNSTQSHLIDACVSKSSNHGVMLSAESAVGWKFNCLRAHTGSASHLHLRNFECGTWLLWSRYACKPLESLGFIWGSSHMSFRFTERLFVWPAHLLSRNIHVSLHARARSSAPLVQHGWAPPVKQHTNHSHSGWSKRATRGYQSDYECRSRGPGKWKFRASPRLWLWQVDVVETRHNNHVRAATDNLASTGPARTTRDSVAATATEKETVRSMLGELRVPLNSRKGGLSVTYNKTLNGTTGPSTGIRRQYWLWTFWRRSTVLSRPPWRRWRMNTRRKMCHMQWPQRWLTSSNGPKRTRTVWFTNWIAPAVPWSLLVGNSPIVRLYQKQQLWNPAGREIGNRGGAHEAICVEARKAWQRAYDLWRKASEAQLKVFSTRKEKGASPTNMPGGGSGQWWPWITEASSACLRPEPRIPWPA